METTLQLSSWGGSTALRIPKQFLQQMNVTNESTVSLKIINDNELIISPVYKHKTLAERFANYDGEPYTLSDEDNEWLNMKSVGEEL